MALGVLQVSSGDRALRASTPGAGEEEHVDASQGKDGVKVKGRWKKNKERKLEEKRREGLEKKGTGRQTRTWMLQKGGGDRRGPHGRGRRAAAQRGCGPGASREGAQPVAREAPLTGKLATLEGWEARW